MRTKLMRAALAALLAGAAAATAASAPAQAAPSTLFGAPTNGAYLASYGPADMLRAFFTGAPGDWATSPKLNVSQPVNVSFKYPPAEVIAGTHDAALRKFFDDAPTNRTVWWTFFHEPEDNIEAGEFTKEQYSAAWQHIWHITQEPARYKSNVKATLVLMDWDLDVASGRNWLDFYPGDAYVDVISWDVYQFKDNNTSTTDNELMAAHQLRRPSLAVTAARGKPYAISELGYLDVTDRPAFLADLANWARSNNAVFVAYYDWLLANDNRLHDTASQQAWASAIDGSLFAGPVTAVNNPATGVTSSSATMSCRVDPHNGSYRVAIASWRTTGGTGFAETPGVIVSDGPETVSTVRTGLDANASYTFRCKIYDANNVLVLKPDTLTFTTTA
ncbi:hypothetical protein CS0771_25510 [Catellatospora sp. IY07-71]|uniref:hypothetical protein n=1 Tax=Catellatospora sp. IY07-71 TaxID=2728827 RepID=UPI001BB453FF|nr:hypothetical protein [Catellatospora sp. IY07-71]BCJ73007.1 hypothetical protein CS0771_25510 [Catellatospora sp. IY07-71]